MSRSPTSTTSIASPRSPNSTPSLPDMAVNMPKPHERSSPGAYRQASTHSGSAIIVPMGYATQMRAMQERQRSLEERVLALEQEVTELKTVKDSQKTIIERLDEIDQRERLMCSRRRECVSQLLNLRTMNQEASNAFDLRAQDCQPDDLEGILPAYASSITTVLNHHQRVFGSMRATGQLIPYGSAASIPAAQPLPQPPQMAQPQPPQAPKAMLPHHPYPPGYTPSGWCRAHNAPYRCQLCGG